MFGVLCAFEARVVSEPELRTSANGTTWSRARVAVDTGVGNRDRDQRDPTATQWVGVRAFREQADQLAALRKGDVVYVEGRFELPVRTYTGRDGTVQAGVDVVANRLLPLGKIGRSDEDYRQRAAANGEGALTARATQAAQASVARAAQAPLDDLDADLDEEIPF